MIAVLVLGSALCLSTVAAATPSSGTARTLGVQGVLPGPQKSEADGIEFKTNVNVKVDDFELTYAAGGFSGWHKHPGIVIATVKSGSVVRKLGCASGETFTVGQTFTEVGIHHVSSRKGAVLSITQIYPVSSASARIDLPAPVCP
jgi:hypothetical protein